MAESGEGLGSRVSVTCYAFLAFVAIQPLVLPPLLRLASYPTNLGMVHTVEVVFGGIECDSAFALMANFR